MIYEDSIGPKNPMKAPIAFCNLQTIQDKCFFQSKLKIFKILNVKEAIIFKKIGGFLCIFIFVSFFLEKYTSLNM